jgi:predicted MPP superfamily phosphohydrolase
MAVLIIYLGLSVGLVAWVWQGAWLGLSLALLVLIDYAMLASLPRFERSYGPPQLPVLSLATLRVLLALVNTLLFGPRPLPIHYGLLTAVQVGLSLAALYACWIEPFRLGVTRITIRSVCLDGCPPLRLLHISDLHVERITQRERALLDLARQLAPDVIAITGDYLNISYTRDSIAQRQTRELLSQLCAVSPVYAIQGSPTVDKAPAVNHVLEGLDLVWLRDHVVSFSWHGRELEIAGLACSYDLEADERKVRGVWDGRTGDAFRLLLYHTPDVMPVAAQLGVDLYLAGHTHGGQLRLPFFGALVTASNYGKRYEMGLYQEGHTRLYVNRGVGMEGHGAPRARFLCPPEIVLFTLRGKDS